MQRDSGRCNLAWIRLETRDLLSSRICNICVTLLEILEKYFEEKMIVLGKNSPN